MGKRVGDVNFDQDVDIGDFNAVVKNFDPSGQNSFNGWSQGNFDGGDDVDISDLIRLIINFEPVGYTSPRPTMTLAASAAVTSWPYGASATTARLLSGTKEGIVFSEFSPKPEYRVDMASETGSRRMDKTIHSADENLFVDQYLLMWGEAMPWTGARRAQARVGRDALGDEENFGVKF